MNNFIKKIKIPGLFKRNPVAFSVAMLLHLVLFIGLLFSGVQRLDKKPENKFKKVASRAIPKAVTIDLSEIKKEKQRLADGKKKKQEKLKYRKKLLKELEYKRYQKQRQINKLKSRAKKEKQENKKKRKAEALKFKEQQRKHELAKAIQLEKEQKIKDAQESILNELKVNYIAQIASRVRSKWRYGGAKDDWSCVVHIAQDNNGVVKNVKLKSCNVDNKNKEKSFKDSIVRAVNKASPLPSAPDKSIFDPDIKFEFRINQDLKK